MSGGGLHDWEIGPGEAPCVLCGHSREQHKRSDAPALLGPCRVRVRGTRCCLCEGPESNAEFMATTMVNALDQIRVVAGLHYVGAAFEPEHMRDLANIAADALDGRAVAPLQDRVAIERRARVYARLLGRVPDRPD